MDEDIRKLLAYVDGHSPEGDFTQEIAAETEKIKQHQETRLEYMTLMMELKEQRREGYAMGEKRGEKRGSMRATLASIRNLTETLHLTAEQAMDALKIPAPEREKYAALL